MPTKNRAVIGRGGARRPEPPWQERCVSRPGLQIACAAKSEVDPRGVARHDEAGGDAKHRPGWRCSRTRPLKERHRQRRAPIRGRLPRKPLVAANTRPPASPTGRGSRWEGFRSARARPRCQRASRPMEKDCRRRSARRDPSHSASVGRRPPAPLAIGRSVAQRHDTLTGRSGASTASLPGPSGCAPGISSIDKAGPRPLEVRAITRRFPRLR